MIFVGEGYYVRSPGDGVGVWFDFRLPTDKTTVLDNAWFETATRKGLRLYVEYPSALPKMEVASPMVMPHGRAVATSDGTARW